MIIVGEKINTSRKAIAEAVENRDAATILDVAEEQSQAGATYVDVNAGTFVNSEPEHLEWLVRTIQGELDIPLSLDTPNPSALAAAVESHKGEPLINSISLEEDRFQAFLPIVKSKPCKVVALCMSQTSMPTTIEERVAVGSELIAKLTEEGVPLENIFVDPLVQPVSVDVRMGPATLGAIRAIMDAFPGVNTICGLSNISFGLPERRLINRSFLTLAMAYGLSAAILDPTDSKIMAALLSVEMILGRDEYCENYIQAYQDGRITSG